MAKNKPATAQDEAVSGTQPEAVAAAPESAETPAAAAKSEASTRPAVGSPQFHELAAQERTQIIADESYDGPNSFQCGHRDCPTIIIKAQDEGQAKARYHQLCGIRGSDNPTSVQPV